MHIRDLDPTDLAALEAAMEAAAIGTNARVKTADGEVLQIRRVEGGWYLANDVTVTSGDVADGEPQAVSLLIGEDYRS
jgi:hypothetical protein